MGVKYKSNEQFFGDWNNEMAYVLGFMFADGNIEDAPYIRAKYVRFTNTDRDRIVAVKSLLEADHLIVQRIGTESRKNCYTIRIGSRALFDRLIQLGVTPNKSLTMKLPYVPVENLGDFVRGYFDGDGCVYIDRDTSGRPKRLLAVFTSGSKSFLEDLHARLAGRIGIEGRGLYRHGSAQGAYQLRYSTRDSLRLFQLMYPKGLMRKLYLKRKYDIFNWYLTKRDISFDEIDLVLTQKGPVAKKQRDGLQNRYARVRIPPGPQIRGRNKGVRQGGGMVDAQDLKS